MFDYYEADFEGFAYQELSDAKDLLELYLDSDLNLDNIKIGFNANSGYVFLIDEDSNTYMDNEGKLEQYFSCGECGREGFKDEFEEDEELECEGCKEIAGSED